MANPFITVPGGPEWAQRAWLAAYLRNQEMQQQYDARPNPWVVAATRGLGAGLEGFFEGRQEGRRVDNLFTMENLQQSGQADRQRMVLDQHARDRDAASRQAMAKLQMDALVKQMETQGRGEALGLLARGQEPSWRPGNPFSGTSTVGGAEPPVFDRGTRPATLEDAMAGLQAGRAAPWDTMPTATEMPPDAYTDALTAPGTPTRVPGQSARAVIAGMPAYLRGLLPDSIASAALKEPDAKGFTEADLKIYDDLMSRGPEGQAAAERFLAAKGGPAGLGIRPKSAVDQAAEAKAGVELQGYRGEIPGVTPEIAAGLVKPAGEPRSQLASMGDTAALLTLITADPGSPVFADPFARVLGTTEDAIRVAARRSLYGDQPPEPGGKLGYERSIAATRAAATVRATDDAKLDLPLQADAQRWINPQTMEAAPSDLTARQAMGSGYVKITDKQFEVLDAVRVAAPLVSEIQATYDPKVIGPVAGRWNRLTEMAGVAPQAFAKLRSATLKYLAAVGRVEAGAALSPTEKAIYFANHPQVDMSPQEFEAALAMTETGLRIARSRVLGTTPVDPGASQLPVGQAVMLEGRRVVIDGVNGDGSVNVHDPVTNERNIWRPR